MNRHLARTLAMQTLYEWDFHKEDPLKLLRGNLEATDHGDDDTTFVTDLVRGTMAHRQKIDQLVTEAAPEWPLEQIAVIDKSILRLAVYELLYSPDVPPKVAIDEAVELGKTFGGDNSSRFVNGVLGTIYRESDRFHPEDSEETTPAEAETGKN